MMARWRPDAQGAALPGRSGRGCGRGLFRDLFAGTPPLARGRVGADYRRPGPRPTPEDRGIPSLQPAEAPPESAGRAAGSGRRTSRGGDPGEPFPARARGHGGRRRPPGAGPGLPGMEPRHSPAGSPLSSPGRRRGCGSACGRWPARLTNAPPRTRSLSAAGRWQLAAALTPPPGSAGGRETSPGRSRRRRPIWRPRTASAWSRRRGRRWVRRRPVRLRPPPVGAAQRVHVVLLAPPPQPGVAPGARAVPPDAAAGFRT